MAQTVAMAMDTRGVRIVLAIVGVIVTIVLGPAVFAAYASLDAVVHGQIDDISELMSGGIAGLGGVIGLIGAWCRLAFSTARLRASRELWAVTCAALAIGVLAAVTVFFVHSAGPYNPAAWWFLALAVFGVLLLVATLGARPNAT
jgi:hypothetical protein